jgi:hypothetical protein
MATNNLPSPGEDGAFNPRLGVKDFFFYGNRVTGLSSVAPTATGIIQIDADADFYCVALTYQADIAGAALTEATNVIPLVNLLVTDSGSGKSFSNIALPIAAYLGDGKRPYRLIRPRVFGATSSIQLAYTAFVAAGTTYNITLVMHGYKRYLGLRGS